MALHRWISGRHWRHCRCEGLGELWGCSNTVDFVLLPYLINCSTNKLQLPLPVTITATIVWWINKVMTKCSSKDQNTRTNLLIQQLQCQGWLADLRIACQCLNNPERSKTKQQNFSVGLIPLQDQQCVSDLDQWPLGDWLREMQALQHSLYTEQQEW